jgi:uncharacterized protein YecE (DUF72 family)
MELRAGTSGFSYAGWKGPFYPDGLPAREMLRFYATQLPAVEINNTFYRLPRASVLEGWAAQVPESFRFAIKASRRITHFKRLAGAEEETAYLLRSTSVLGPRLGALLFQLPPQAKADLARLEAFLDLLPAGLRAAFEFRHPSWQDAPVAERLGQRGHALVAVDADGGAEPELAGSGGWGYLRLRRSGYERSELAAWAARIAASGWQEAFVFFKHEEAGAGPALARELLELAARAAARRGPRRGGAKAARPAASGARG